MVPDKLRRKSVNTIKKIIGVQDWSLFQKRIRKRIGRFIYRKHYSADDVVAAMKSLGLKEGQLVCIHAAMREFYNYDGTAEDLINSILKAIGPNGTIMMPAFPSYSLLSEDYIMDVNKDPTGAGALAECFRHFPGVKRSINVQHSVCALGPLADYLLKDHQDCEDCWDANSPWGRLCQLNGIVFTLGTPVNWIPTFQHCVESTLKNSNDYWRQFFKKNVVFKYWDEHRNIKSYSCQSSPDSLIRIPNNRRTIKWFTTRDRAVAKVSNLSVVRFYSGNCLKKMISLGYLGISPYKYPSTKGFMF